MSAKLWFIQIVAVSLISAAAVVLVPQLAARSSVLVEQCVPASALAAAPAGHAACVLKTGRVIYVRSAK